jgi:PQQ-dependent dehydrogenase (methanol/ethanol family)
VSYEGHAATRCPQYPGELLVSCTTRAEQKIPKGKAMRLLRSATIAATFLICGASCVLAQVADRPTNRFSGDPAAIAAGMAVYNATCVGCHKPGGSGPALNTGDFTHGDDDYDIFQVIRAGIVGTQMPSFSSLSADNVWRVVAYLKSLSKQAAPVAQPVATGDATAGENVFFAKGGCNACHEINGRGLDLAPDLSAEGTRPAIAIRNGILHQTQAGAHGPQTYFADVTLADGHKVNGLIRAEDSFSLQLEQRDGKLLLLDKKNVRAIANRVPVASADIASRLSAPDIDNLVAYLINQKARNQTLTAKVVPAPVLTYERLVAHDKEANNWPTYWGDYSSHHFSELKQITPANIGHIQARWAASLPGPSVLESVPLVVDGVMYVTGPPGNVYAIDARSGLTIWHYHRDQEVKNPYEINPFNKGLALLDGRIFFGTLDNFLVALDAHTGRLLWDKHLAETLDGYTLTGAPLALKDKIIMGMSGGEMGVRGWLDAYDPASGNQLWRFYTIPKPDEPGGNTWPRDTWQHGGGATWLTGSYDPVLNALYWPTGNPGPTYNPDIRKGDNLYTDSVVALDPDTGKLKWHFQFTPNDGHDWDSTEAMVLADQVIDGKTRKLILHADRNAMFYALDRSTGKLLWAKPFVKATWNKGFDANGRAIIDPSSLVTPQGQVAYPAGAATNFGAPSYDKTSGLMFVPFNDAQGFVASAPAVYERGKEFLGRRTATSPPAPAAKSGVAAIDTKTGKIIWRYITTSYGDAAGLIATRGGVVFVATQEGEFIALEAKTGKALWHYRTSSAITSSPISYALDGKQYIAVSAGNQVLAFALPN